VDPDGFNKMADSIEKLALNDRSLTIQRESSTALGQGSPVAAPIYRRLSHGISRVFACWHHCGSAASRIRC